MAKWLILPLLLFLSACSSWERVEIDGKVPPPYGVSPGTLCTIETLDGQSHVFRVTKVSDTSFFGEEIEIPFQNIKKIEIKEDPDTGAWAVMSTPFVIVGLLAIAIGAALGG